jgi:DNA-binding transcriptional MerR regulator
MSEKLTIGEVSARLGLTLRALRFYESKNLVEPEREGTRRLYSEADSIRLEHITKWRAAGIPIAEIRYLLRLLDDGDENGLRQALSYQLSILDAEIATRRFAIDELRSKAA